MGDNIFSSREQMLQNEALQGYMNSFNLKQQEGLEGKEKAEAYNKILEGITEPIGGLMVGKPVEKVVSLAGRKLLMKAGGEKFLRKAFVKTLSKASNGDLSAFGKDLPSNVEGSIKDVLSDNVPDRISQAFGKLSKKSQNAINDAREKMGKSRLGDRNESEPVDSEVQTTPINDPPSDAPVPQSTSDLPVGQGGGEGGLADLGFTEEDAEGLFQPPPPAPEFTQVAFSQGQITQPSGVGDSEFGDEPLEQAKSLGTDVFQQRADIQQAQADAVKAQEPTQPDNPNPDGSDQSSGSSEQPSSADNGDSNDAGGENQENTDLPDPNSPSDTGLGDASDATGAGDDVLDGLQGASDAIDAVAGAEGGLNIFADILAGIIGIGTLIGGATGGKKAKPTQTDYLTSGVQYGV